MAPLVKSHSVPLSRPPDRGIAGVTSACIWFGRFTGLAGRGVCFGIVCRSWVSDKLAADKHLARLRLRPAATCEGVYNSLYKTACTKLD